MNRRRMLVAMCTGAFLLASCANPSGSNPVRSEASTTTITSQAFNEPPTTLAAAVAVAGTTTTAPSQSEPETDDVPDTEVGDPDLSDAPFVPLDLAIGTCFDDPDADVELVTPDDIPVVECDSPHANEVFDSIDMGEGEFPGATDVQAQAEILCLDAFEAYVGVEYTDTVLDFSWYFPTAESWMIGGTNIICFAYRTDLSSIEGSVEGAGR